jgi:hypothetical protein
LYCCAFLPLLLQHDDVKAHVTQNPNVTVSSSFEPRLVGAASAGAAASKTIIKAAFHGPGLLLGAAATAGMALYGKHHPTDMQ